MGTLIIPDEMIAGEYLITRCGATVADYERLADEDTRLDLLDEVLIMHSPANVRHEEVFWFLGTVLRGYVAEKDLGRVYGSRTAMYLEERRRFEPDLLFIATANLGRLGESALTGPADLVIEILSPATIDYDLGRKRDAYADGGVPEYWMIDPMNSRFRVDRPAGNRVSEPNAGRYESAAIKGLWLDVGWLWQTPLPGTRACLDQVLA